MKKKKSKIRLHDADRISGINKKKEYHKTKHCVTYTNRITRIKRNVCARGIRPAVRVKTTRRVIRRCHRPGHWSIKNTINKFELN